MGVTGAEAFFNRQCHCFSTLGVLPDGAAPAGDRIGMGRAAKLLTNCVYASARCMLPVGVCSGRPVNRPYDSALTGSSVSSRFTPSVKDGLSPLCAKARPNTPLSWSHLYFIEAFELAT